MPLTSWGEAKLPASHLSIQVIPLGVTDLTPDIARADFQTARAEGIASSDSEVSLHTA